MRSIAPRQRGLLQFAFSLSAITYLDRICISAAAPAIMADLNLSVLQMSLVFSAFTLAYSLFEVPSGWLGDAIGARRVLTRIVLWWSGFTMLTGAAWSLPSLVAIRFLFGAGEAGAFPNISQAFSTWIAPSDRGTANGVLFLGSRLGGAAAPVIAFFLVQRVGWRWSFVIFGALGIFWAWAWFTRYRDQPDAAVQAHSVELSRIDRAGIAARPPWAHLFRSRNMYAICGMYFSFGFGLYFYFTWLPTYLVNVLGFSTLAGGLLAGLPFVLAGAADVIGGWLTDRLAVSRGLKVARSGLGTVAFGSCALLVLASVLTTSPLTKALLLACALASADLALSACWAVCLDVGGHHAGVVTGFMNTAGNLGGLVGPVVFGIAVERWNSWTIPFLVTTGVYLVGAMLWATVDPEKGIAAGARAPLT